MAPLGCAGMALDLTSTQVPVPHPSPDQEDVGPSPVLCLGTSDAVFRFFSLGSRNRTAPPCVAAPRGVPPTPEVRWLVQQSEVERPLAVRQAIAGTGACVGGEDRVPASPGSQPFEALGGAQVY